MIKIVFIIFNLMGIMAYHLNDEEVTVAQEIPEKISSGESFVAKLVINKGNHEGYAIWQQELPEGFQAEMMETRGGTFSFKGNTLKLIWLELPEEESYTITYRVNTDANLSKKKYDFSGKYSYLSKNDRIDVFSQNKTILIENPDHSIRLTEKKEKTDAQTEEETEVIINFDTPGNKPVLIKKPIKNSPATKAPPSFEYKKSKQEKVTISYKVQIAAGHSKLKKNYFTDYFQIDDYVSTELHNGWKKYTIGYFSDYKTARNKRNDLWAKHHQAGGAFVTAYLEGQRISVEEALKISEEKWIK